MKKCCLPDCTGVLCGDDGCGGSCGECTGDFSCHMGECVNYPEKYSGPCSIRGDIYNDGTEDYIFAYNYYEDGKIWIEDYDAYSDGQIDRRTTYTYYNDGNPYQRQYDWSADGIIEFLVTYTYYRDGNLETETEEDFEENPTWIKVIKIYYDSLGRKQTSTMDIGDDGVIESLVTYRYYKENGLLHTIEYDEKADGTVDFQVIYYYEGNVVIKDYDDPAGGDPEERDVFTYDDNGNLVMEEWDYGVDGVVDHRFTWIYNDNGCLSREEVDYDANYSNDYLYIYSQDRHCNILDTWEINPGRVETVEVYSYDCWF